VFPVVGQQVTVSRSDASSAAARVALLEARAAAGDCDLVVHGWLAGREHGFVFSGGVFVQDAAWEPSLSPSELLALVGLATPSLTFTAVPPGSGWRIGIDRDSDGVADGDELAAGAGFADPDARQ
jgi:hypothetical protein